MDLIKRPKQVNRSDKGYMTNEQYQDYSQKQLLTIYNKIDEIIKNTDYQNGNEEEY